MKKLFLLFLLCNVVYADTGAVRISCNPPTERENGAPFKAEEVNFYLIYLTQPNGKVTEFKSEKCELDLLLEYGTYSHRDVVCDKNLLCSTSSTVKKFTVDSPPKKPSYPSIKKI